MARKSLRIAKRGVAVRPSGWRWRHILAAAAGHGPSGEVDPWGGGWRRKERGGTERGGGEGRGGDGRGRATHPDEPCQCLHALTGGGRRGAWHQLGLLMGSCSWVASPQICVTGEEMLLAGTTRTTTALSGRHGAELNRAARAGQLRLDSCERDARGSMHARCWDALDCIWYARLLERCHRPSGAHPSREGRRWRRCDACGSRWYRAKSCQSRSEPPGPRFSSQVATERPRGVF